MKQTINVEMPMETAVDEPVEELLRVPEVARRTGITERTIRQMIADGRLPAVRPERVRVVLIPANAVRELVQAKT